MKCSICNQEHIFIPATHSGAVVCQTCAARLARSAPALLRGCEAAVYLLGRLWMPNKPTVAEAKALRDRLLALVAAVRGAETPPEPVEESWPDTSPGYLMSESAAQPDYDEWLDWETEPVQPATPTGFTFWREMGDPPDWHTW